MTGTNKRRRASGEPTDAQSFYVIRPRKDTSMFTAYGKYVFTRCSISYQVLLGRAQFANACKDLLDKLMQKWPSDDFEPYIEDDKWDDWLTADRLQETPYLKNQHILLNVLLPKEQTHAQRVDELCQFVASTLQNYVQADSSSTSFHISNKALYYCDLSEEDEDHEEDEKPVEADVTPKWKTCYEVIGVKMNV